MEVIPQQVEVIVNRPADCNANEYCDYSAYACKPKNSNGGTCTMSEQCVGFCDDTVSKCIAKNNDALCSSSDQCVSGDQPVVVVVQVVGVPVKVVVTLKLDVIMTQ